MKGEVTITISSNHLKHFSSWNIDHPPISKQYDSSWTNNLKQVMHDKDGGSRKEFASTEVTHIILTWKHQNFCMNAPEKFQQSLLQLSRRFE